MTRQDQSVGEGGQAIQTQGNVTITHGLTPEQMLVIMEGVERQVQRGIDRAADVVDARLAEFKAGVIEEFAKPESNGKTEAFNDPDFQYALHEAQKGFARSGEQGLKDELVKLLAQRSNEPGRTRTALILNEAIQTIASLTPQEVSALALMFLIIHVKIISPADKSQIFERYRAWITPFIDDFPTDNHSFEYLGSMRCLVVNQISHTDVWEVMLNKYRNVFSSGFTKSTLISALNGKEPSGDIAEPVINNFAGLMRFKPATKDELIKIASEEALVDPATENLKTLWDKITSSDDEIRRILTAESPQIAGLADKWSSTSAKQSNLTGLGKAIAHSALTSRTNFNAPLEIWVR